MVEIRKLDTSVTAAGKIRSLKMPTPKKKIVAEQRRLRNKTLVGSGRGRPITVVRRTQATHPSPTPQPTPCRLWQGRVDSHGYSMYTSPDRRKDGSLKLYRYMIEMLIGRNLDIDEHILHLCDNPACFRIDHLQIGTHAANMKDMRVKGRAKPPPVNRFLGERHPNAKLTSMDINYIFEQRQAGWTMKAIAERLNCSRSTVERICKGTAWAHITRSESPSGASERTTTVKEKQ